MTKDKVIKTNNLQLNMVKYSNYFSELIGFDFIFNLSELKGDKFKIEGTGDILITTKDYSKQVVSPLMHSAIRAIEEFTNTYEIINNKVLIGFTEEICLALLFPDYHNLSENDQYQKLLFINDLKEICGKAYETKPVNLGILILKNNESLDFLLNYFEFDFISISTPKTVKELLTSEKPLLKLIDNESLVFVTNEEHLVIGFFRKKDNSKGIKQAIEEEYDIREMNSLYRTIISNLHEKAKNINSSSQDGLLEKVRGELALKNYEIDEKAIEKFINIFLDSYPQLPAFLEEKQNSIVEFDDLIKHFDYIYIKNRTIHWLGNFSFQLTFNNNHWNVRHFGILVAYIFEYIYDYSEMIVHAGFEKEFVISSIKPIIRSVNKLVMAIKNLSLCNEGALFIIIDDKYTTDIPETLVKTGNTEYKNIIKTSEPEVSLNIENCDITLIERLASIDGSIIIDRNLNVLTFGEITDNNVEISEGINSYGGRTKAAIFASKYGLAIKVSEDGDIELYKNQERILKL